MKVRRASDGKEFVLSRGDLHAETEKLIKEFLAKEGPEAESEEEPNAENIGDREIIKLELGGEAKAMAGRVSIQISKATFHCTLKQPFSVKHGNSSGITVSAGNRGSLRIIEWGAGGLERCREDMDKDRELQLKLARNSEEGGSISPADLTRIEKLLEIRKVEWGPWEGYTYAKRTKADTKRLGHNLGAHLIRLTDGKRALRVTADPFPSPVFNETAVAEFMESLSID
ncbi:MAG: hypothetical protein AAGI48_15080 [Verrucomicrobiota bacterium]